MRGDETVYGPVLQEAKRVGIPVIMIDRDVVKDDKVLLMPFMGSDFVMEGEKAGTWLANFLKNMKMDDGTKTIDLHQTGRSPNRSRRTTASIRE